MSKSKKIVYLFISVLFFIFFNGYISNIIIDNGNLLQENPVFDITVIQNIGAAFNIFEGYRTFLICFSVAALIFVISYTVKHIQQIPVIGLFFVSLLCSGIFCNMYERIFFGYVRDFIKLNFVDFPIFNISDIFINIGVFAIIILLVKKNYFTKN